MAALTSPVNSHYFNPAAMDHLVRRRLGASHQSGNHESDVAVQDHAQYGDSSMPMLFMC